QVTRPLALLCLLALASTLFQPYEPQMWSVLVAKWGAPFNLFELAGWTFHGSSIQDQHSLGGFEIFLLVILGYLSLTAIFFLFGETSFILPPFIVDESIGIHA